jgi:glycosyltransferase involved in cell wall biosynthesis
VWHRIRIENSFAFVGRQRLRAPKYMIVGDGDDRGRLEEKVTSLGLSEQIIFAGKISE